MSFKKFAAAEKAAKGEKPTEPSTAAPLIDPLNKAAGPRADSSVLENPVTPTTEPTNGPPAPTQGS